jgi:beta-galactosidase GanA
LLDQTIACGLNAIAAYVYWNVHERRLGEFGFAGNNDLGHFLSLCHARGLALLLRMGPYCCAEWNYGGFPAWLRDEPGITIRTWLYRTSRRAAASKVPPGS